jgi:nitrate/TMAO reductase-like tetraheme cytochrome c subunit
VAIVVVGGLFAFEPVTRNLVAMEPVCSYCHGEREYVPEVRLSFSTVHPPAPKEGEAEGEAEAKREAPADCVDCHLPEGFWAATFAYSHYTSATDLFGHSRDRASERAGDWIPASAARAYRVRDRLFEYDSNTCRTCHIEAEIKPKRKRGQNAHKKALEEKQTCIECHDNLVHRYVELRETAFQAPEASDSQ